MILRFNLKNCLNLYASGKLESFAINPDGEKYINQWRKFAISLYRMRDAGHQLGRTEYSFIDRTGTVPSIVNTYIAPEQQIPTGKPAQWDFLDICLTRAQELLDTGKHINVMWSGGLDSSIVLFSLIRQARNLDQLSVLCTFESIVESGKMFDSIIANSGIRVKFDQNRSECRLPYTYDNEDPTQLYVDGQCGDQLFGGGALAFVVPGSLPTDSWHQKFSQDFLDMVEPSFKSSPRPIDNLRDLRWWLFFNYAWTSTLYDHHIERPPDQCKRQHAFYATPEFQRWAMYTPTYYEKMDQYRWPAKQALSQLIDYPYYIENKKKCFSVNWHQSQHWHMLDKNFKTYYNR